MIHNLQYPYNSKDNSLCQILKEQWDALQKQFLAFFFFFFD